MWRRTPAALLLMAFILASAQGPRVGPPLLCRLGSAGERQAGAVRAPPVFATGWRRSCRRKAVPWGSREQALPTPPSTPGSPAAGGQRREAWFPQGRPQKTVSLFPGLPAPGSIAPTGARRLPGPSRLRPRRQAFSSSPLHPPPAALLSANP